MMSRIVALAGLSGVGKSTLLVQAAVRLPFQHLQASALIKKGRELAHGQVVAHDCLRYVDLDENQQFLIKGLKASINPDIRLTVLDCHTLVERDADHFMVQPEVFAAIGLDAMIFLIEESLEIQKRRANDQSRSRPAKTAAALADMQAKAVAQATLICRRISIPLHFASSSLEDVVELLHGFFGVEGF